MKKKAKGKIEMISSGLNELETPIRQACNLAKALLIMSSGENMPDDEGEGIFGVAETLVRRRGANSGTSPVTSRRKVRHEQCDRVSAI
jgi:hypothetical protein